MGRRRKRRRKLSDRRCGSLAVDPPTQATTGGVVTLPGGRVGVVVGLEGPREGCGGWIEGYDTVVVALHLSGIGPDGQALSGTMAELMEAGCHPASIA